MMYRNQIQKGGISVKTGNRPMSFVFIICLQFVFAGGVCSDTGSSIYRDYILQRIRLARIRDFQGDPAAKATLENLINEARKNGVALPRWADDGVGRNYAVFRNQKARTSHYDSIILKAAGAYRLPPALIKAVIRAESGFDSRAISHKGARGLMQLMLQTADALGVRNSFDPRANIFGGAKLLRKHLNEFGSLKSTLIAYNAGPDYVRGNHRIPGETRRYLRKVIAYYRYYEKEGFGHVHTN
jgi:soluble lytic murein transglycosylase-like protein